ncbi:hypothetical protein [Asticcacaulis sp. 201]|uniref:hypothetical protein n=1 Tax=Asticcacaulis sp. 201 TaxID=3028787 RepID=UPI0029167966|nr:hypothetical protein [Asticcacaulis sp. 201]MDV6332839.1 hypothetical protein [Asticcacaulis sp. 201]
MKTFSAAMIVGYVVLISGITAQAAAPAAKPPAAKPAIVVPQTTTTTDYNPTQGFPDRNGRFSAMLVVVPQQELSQFAKPSGEGRQLSRVNRAEPGAVLAIKVLYTGLAADKNGNGEVTYDVQVYQPDGTLYASSDYRHLAGSRGPIGDGQAVYDNREKVVLIQFEPQDKPGIYTIKATARDEVAQIAVPLQTQVELLTAPPVSAQSAPAVTAAPAADAPKSKKKHRRKHRR